MNTNRMMVGVLYFYGSREKKNHASSDNIK